MITDHSKYALIVEDDSSWQAILRELIEDAGLQADLTDNATDALALAQLRPHYLAIIDLSLNEQDHNNRDGLQVLEALRRHDPDCIAILLTGYATVELAVSAITDHRYRAFTCLRKETFQRAQFRELLSKALSDDSQAATVNNKSQPQPDLPDTGNEPVYLEQAGVALIAEDDSGWRSILAELLSGSGYTVHPAASFGEALGLLRRKKFNLAVIDLSLTPTILTSEASPGREARQSLDGFRLLAVTRASHIPTIVISGLSSPAEIELAYERYSIHTYMEKQTFDRRKFLQTLQDIRPAQQIGGNIELLSEREMEVLELLAQGLTNKEIGERLVIAPNTVKRHVKAIFEKLDIHTRAAAAAKLSALRPPK